MFGFRIIKSFLEDVKGFKGVSSRLEAGNTLFLVLTLKESL